ncbi:MAG TPA: MlaD family protein [Solirubrobacteraceae bacterium]|nr:MlaD family protein [Solirubrobacteraceae bacterium]
MRRRSGRDRGMLGNPVVIGALTVLVAIAAVSLAYQADNGLPFVPKYALHVQIPDAEELTHGGEVHMGGALIGLVTTIDTGRGPAGQPIAVLNLSLDKKVQPLPVNSVFDVRLKGSIGLKYLDVLKGNSPRGWKNGATVPLGHSTAEVDLDQVLSMFNPPTRTGVTQSTIGFSDALAGRGGDINNAIAAFRPLVNDLLPVATNLASSKSDFGGFFRGLERFSSAVAPVAAAQASLYSNLDTTFKAIAPVAVPFLQQWISDTPPTFSTVAADSPRLQAFVNDTAGLFGELRPGFATLPSSAPVLADAFAAGTRNLPGSTALDQRTVTLAQTLRNFGDSGTVQGALDRLTLTAHSLRSPLAFLTPVQATCNYVTLFLRNIGSTLAENLVTGTALRFNLVTIDDVQGAESVPSQKPFTTPNTSSANEHGPLHVNPYPNTNSPGQTAECAAGNEPYSGTSALIGNPPGNLGLKTQTTTRPKG